MVMRAYNENMVTCILLGAGLSSRFGSPKALARLARETVVEYLQKILIDSKINEIIVVLGDRCAEIKPYILNHEKVRVVYNKDYIFGQTSSFKTGLREVSRESRGVMLLPVDVPAVKRQTIDFLVEQFLARAPSIIIPTCKGKHGHPPVFNMKLKKRLLEWEDMKGLNVFEREHAQETLLCPVEDEGILRSFNTPQEFEELKTYLAF